MKTAATSFAAAVALVFVLVGSANAATEVCTATAWQNGSYVTLTIKDGRLTSYSGYSYGGSFKIPMNVAVRNGRLNFSVTGPRGSYHHKLLKGPSGYRGSYVSTSDPVASRPSILFTC